MKILNENLKRSIQTKYLNKAQARFKDMRGFYDR